MNDAPIREKLEGLEHRGPDPRGWLSASCPVPSHIDRHFSFGWRVEGDGHVQVKCQAGCPTDAIVAALGLTMADLFPPKTNGATGPPRRAGPRPVARYDYHAADGSLAYYVQRTADKQFPTFRPDGSRIGDTPRFPYRLPDIVASRRGVVVVEGEKDADRLAAHGFVATTNDGGAGHWRTEISEHLRGRTVVVIPDNDEKGRQHAADVAHKLAGIAREVRLLELAGLDEKGDVSDWLDAGHSIDDLRAALLAAPLYVPPTVPTIAATLSAVEAFLRRFIVFGRPEAVAAVVLWIAHTYLLEFAVATPYLAVTSPEKGSGKTRLLECLRLLARGRPEIFIIPTASTIYRMLQADPDGPLLLDELDAVFRDRSDKYEEVRAIINAGHRRGAKVPRTVTTGNRHEVHMFPVFGPRALAGIGRLPDTVADRSIPVLTLKKKRSEKVEKFRDAGAGRDAAAIVRMLEAVRADAAPARDAAVPDELPDRAADAWEPLLAIADLAGGSWPSRARAAAIILHADRADDESLGLRMLADTRLVFDRLGVDRLATTALIDALRDDEESPWVGDKPLTPVSLAGHLRPFGIRSRQLKVDGANVRGFLRESFIDSWERYLPEPATPPPDPLPRYPERAKSSGVAGSRGGSGSDAGLGEVAGMSVSDEMEAIFGGEAPR